MKRPLLNVAAFLERSRINGPGTRAVVWLQGCPRRPPCAGCYNPSMLPADAEVEGVAPRDLAQRIMALDGIDGVTFTGGEPFLQSAGLAALAALLGERGLSVVTFTGYTLEQLRLSQDPDQQMLLARTDLLVDGPYVEALRDRLPLRGSTNQRLHYLSGRLGPADLDGLPLAEAELCIDARGDIALSGFPDEELLSLIRSAGAPR